MNQAFSTKARYLAENAHLHVNIKLNLMMHPSILEDILKASLEMHSTQSLGFVTHICLLSICWLYFFGLSSLS